MCAPLIAAIPAIASSIGAFASTAGGAFAIASAATSAVSLLSQRAAAKAQTQALNAQAAQEREDILDKSEEELGQRVRAAREQRSRALVAGGESGAMGASLSASLNQSLQDQDFAAALVQKNVAFNQRSTDTRRNTALAGIRSPSALEAGLKIVSAGVGGFSTGLSIKAQIDAVP